MAMNIWRCHMVADTSTQRIAEPVYHTENSENPSKHEDKATRYAFIIPSILVSVSCPKIVQWDTINYNQAALSNPIDLHRGVPYYAYHVCLRRYLVDAQELYLFILTFIYISCISR